jgi:hypothetical protein
MSSEIPTAAGAAPSAPLRPDAERRNVALPQRAARALA